MQIKHSFLIKYKLFYCAYFLLLVPRIYISARESDGMKNTWCEWVRERCVLCFFFGVNLAIWRLLNFLYRAKEQQQRLKALKYVNMPGNISCAHIQNFSLFNSSRLLPKIEVLLKFLHLAEDFSSHLKVIWLLFIYPS